jgi:L-gulono-1,4-lactone dehydrogenase
MSARRLTWRNHSHDQECRPRRIVHPSTTAELQAIVRDAERDGVPVRAVGAGHAWSDVALTDGVLVETDRLTGVQDAGEHLVRVRSGTRIRGLNAALDARGLGLVNVGGYDGQAIAGVVATSTHGSGLGFGPFPDYVESIDLVASEGRSVHFERGDEGFDAAVSRLGAEFGARPHWGQYNVLGPGVAALYPRWSDWLAVHERMNATGVFDSEFTARIGISRRPGP